MGIFHVGIHIAINFFFALLIFMSDGLKVHVILTSSALSIFYSINYIVLNKNSRILFIKNKKKQEINIKRNILRLGVVLMIYSVGLYFSMR